MLIHRTNQLYIRSCNKGSKKCIQKKLLDYTRLIEQIESQDYVIVKPPFIKEPTQPKKGKEKNNPPEKKKSNPREEDNRGEKVMNTGLDERCRLASDEQYKLVFHPALIRMCPEEIPTIENKMICHKYHCLGHCYANCKYKDTHKPMPAPVLPLWLKVLTFLRDKCKELLTNNSHPGERS